MKMVEDSLSSNRIGRRSALGVLLAFAFLELVYLWLITHGTFQLIASEDPVTLSTAYDSLGQHLLQGSSAVDRNSIGWEAFPSKGRTVMYFGPFPAFVRIAISALVPGWSGRLARLSCFLAASLSLFVVAAIARRELVENTTCPVRLKAALLYGTILGFGLASPLFLHASMAAIYHEAIWWGLFWNLFGLWLLFRVRLSGIKTRHVALLGVATGFAMLSRITFALPLFLGLAYWSFTILRERPRALPMVVRSLIPFALMVSFQVWYNYDRFDQFFVMVDWKNYALNTPEREQNGTFNAVRTVPAFRAYVLPYSDNVNASYPWLLPRRLRSQSGGLFSTSQDEFLTALLLTCPWLLLTASIGAAGAVTDREAHSVLLLLFFLLEALLVLSYYWVTQRYILEFVPLLLAGHVLFLRWVGRSKRTAAVITTALVVLLPLCAFTTEITTFAWSLSQQGIPRQFRERLLENFFVR
jgi:4-amino-4-deoxy-L-arabinose transferase-like glycosyltransferase